MKISPSIFSVFPLITHSTAFTLLFSIQIFFTKYPFFIFPPFSSIFSARVSQSCPGPYLGYQNCSINDVSTLVLSFLPNIFEKASFITAFIDKPFGNNIQMTGDKAYSFPDELPDLTLQRTYPHLK